VTNEFLHFILAIAIIIVAAKLGGLISIRLGQPSVLGELVAGILLGPTVLNMLHVWPIFASDEVLPESLTQMAEIGVILLMFLAGLELEIGELLRSGKVAALAGSLGVIVPLLMGVGTALLFGSGINEAVFIGLALSATSVSISAQTLMELGVLRSEVGLSLLGAAVFDDILVILLLSTASIVLGTGGAETSLLFTVLRMVLYLAAAIAVGAFVIPPAARIVSELPISQGVVAFAVVVVLFYAWSAEELGGVASITGAFLAGLFFARTPLAGQIETGLSALAYGFFVPIFFVNIGLESDLRAISGDMWLFAIALTVVAIVSKVIGSGAGALLGGLQRRDSLRLGIGMISRGEVGLIVASVALVEGMITQDIFSIVVFMVIVATLITPPLLRASYSGGPKAEPTSGSGS
jgi:Kef-type K+ transport system membrane component KefB